MQDPEYAILECEASNRSPHSVSWNVAPCPSASERTACRTHRPVGLGTFGIPELIPALTANALPDFKINRIPFVLALYLLIRTVLDICQNYVAQDDSGHRGSHKGGIH